MYSRGLFISSWQYDDNGNQTRREDDRDGDGTPDWIWSWQYDDNGDLTRWEADDDGDGTPESIETFQYEATGWGYVFSR